MPSKKKLKQEVHELSMFIHKQSDTIDVLKRIIDKIYPKQSESFQDKIDRDISHPLPYKRTKDINPDIFKNCQFMDRIIVPETQKDFSKCLTTVPSNLFKNHPQVTVCELEDLDNGR